VNGKLKKVCFKGVDATGTGQDVLSDHMQTGQGEDSSSGAIDMQEGEPYLGQAQLKLAMQNAVVSLSSRLIAKTRCDAVLRLTFALNLRNGRRCSNGQHVRR